MKKIIFVIVAVLISFAAFAQRGIPRTDNVSVSSTVVIKTIKKSESKFRFQQMPEVQVGYAFDSEYLIGGSYTAGCRFSNWLFLGCGVGYAHSWREWLPIYVHFRGYFSKRPFKPYASLSLGGVIYSYDYAEYLYDYAPDFGFHGEFSIGVEIPVHEKINLIAGVGISQMGVPVKIGISF